jgi:hypothetical protein
MLKMYPVWKYVTKKFTDGQPSTSNNKLSLEVDRNNPYRGLGSSSSMFPSHYNGRNVASILHHDHPAGHQTISVSRTTVDTAPATRTVGGLSALPTVNVIDTQQEQPSGGVIVGEHSASQKVLPIHTEETFSSSQNNMTGKIEFDKVNQLDDYLRRAAEMLKLGGVDDNLRDLDLSRYFSEIKPDTLKDTKHLGNSVDIELEQNTSGDLLNVSLSDDGILQEETSRTLVSFSHKGDENKNISQKEQVNINDVNNKDEVMNKNVQNLHLELKPAYLEQESQETVTGRGGDVQNFETLLDSCVGEIDNQQQKNVAIGGGDSVIPDKGIYTGGTVFETEEQSELPQRKQQYSKLNDKVQYHDIKLNGQKKMKGFERTECDSKASANVIEGDAERQWKDNNDKSSAQGLIGEKFRETSANESRYITEEEQLGDKQFMGQKCGNENDQHYYQQHAEQLGDQYYQYGKDEMFQHHIEAECGQQYDEQCVSQEGEQYYQYGQNCEDQCMEQYSQQFVDHEGLQYNQQEGQYDQYLGQQEGQYDEQCAAQQEGQYDQQYMEQEADQCDRHYEDYQQEQKDNQLILKGQQISEDNQGVGNQADTREQHYQISEEPVQMQQLEVQGDKQESAGDVSNGSSFEDGKYQEQMKAYEAIQGDVGTTGAEEEKTLNKEVEDKMYDSSARSKQPDVSSDLTKPSSTGCK